jgi:hypothetical protein
MKSEAKVDMLQIIHCSRLLEKVNGLSFIIPQAIKPIGIMLQHKIEGSQKTFLCKRFRSSWLLNTCIPIIKNANMNNIDPIFASPNVVGISANIPPIGLAHGVVKVIKGSQTMTIVIKLSFTFVSFSKNLGDMDLTLSTKV